MTLTQFYTRTNSATPVLKDKWMTKLTEQILIFDADDTLWECNTYFEQAIHSFIDFLHAEHLSREEIREVLDTFERKNGYGARAFARSLVDTYRELATENDPGDEETIERLGLAILEQEMEAIDGVEETLIQLQPHHTLILFTKGDEEEQLIKIGKSRLSRYFEFHIVTHDKTVASYNDVLDSLDLDRTRSWMIGNSMRSDILPALEAGISAIYVPNLHTWHMENVEYAENPDWPGRYLDLKRITQLADHFATESAG